MEPANVTSEQLEEANQQYKKALELRDSDPETAIELLGKVLETRNQAFGEKAFECAEVYLHYGELLFEQAQANTDYFGDQMKSAALQRARQLAAGDAGGAAADSGDENAEDDDEEEAAGEAYADIDTAEEAAATPATAATAAAAAAASAEDQPAADAEQGEAAAEAKEGEPKEDAAEAAAAEGNEDQGKEDEQGDDEEDDEDVGSEDADDAAAAAAAAAGEGQEQVPEVTGESDDMALAWEMLEMARLIYGSDAHGGRAAHADKLADCHMYIADILCEQEKFEEAVPEYDSAVELLGGLAGGLAAHRRRAAELDFKRANALQLVDKPGDALSAIRSAKAHLQAHLNELNIKLAASSSKAGSGGAAAAAAGDASGAAAFAAFASVLSSYSKPAGPQQDEATTTAAATKDKAAAEADAEVARALAKLQQEAAEIREVIEGIDDKIDELTAAEEAHASMKEQLRATFAMAAGVGGPDAADGEAAAADAAGGAGSSAAAAAGTVESVGFAAPTLAVSAPVKDMGVIGKGKRVAPVPVAPAAAAPAAGDAAADGEAAGQGVSKKRQLSDLASSDQENGGEAAAAGAAGDGAASKAAPTAGSAPEQQPDAFSKKARA